MTELEEYPSIIEYAADEPNDNLLKEIIKRQLIAQAQNDKVMAVFHKNPTTEINIAIQSISKFNDRRKELQSIYNSAVEELGGTSEVDFLNEPTEHVLAFLNSLSTVTVNKAPADWPMEYQVYTHNQMNLMARNQVLSGFLGQIDLMGAMSRFGATYQPSVDVQEIAALTAMMVIAYQEKARTSPQIVTPGKLYRPQ